MEYARGAARFLTGTPNVPAHYAATAGYDLIEEVGVERIRANSLRQTQLLIDLADAAGFDVRSPREPARRGGTVTVHVPEFPAVYRELMERADHLRLPARRRHPARPALLQHRRRASLRGRPDRARSSRQARSNATSAPSRGIEFGRQRRAGTGFVGFLLGSDRDVRHHVLDAGDPARALPRLRRQPVRRRA